MHYSTGGSNNVTKLLVSVVSGLSVLFLALPVSLPAAEKKFTLLLTSNLHGKFTLEKENQDENDPMLLLAQSIISERNKSGFDIYLDLGNAFYPGTLTRYSYGSVMMDFFNYFKCEATLISSRDISIGLSNLEFLSKGKTTKMISANITKDSQPVFAPYIVVQHSGRKIGIIGVSSVDGLFDIADKKVLNITFGEYRELIKKRAEKLKQEGCSNLILLSGLSYKKNIELLQEIPDVNLVISGGDSTGSLFSVPSSRVDLQWGRSVITLLQSDGYYKVELDLGEGITVDSMNFVKTAKHKTPDPAYKEFTNRLSIWKEKFRTEENRLIADKISSSAVTDENAANMLRHRYRTEIGIIEKYSIHPRTLEGPLYYSTIMTFVNDDYPIFTYRLSGKDLSKVLESSGDLIITGINNGKVQDYPVAEGRKYTISSTQVAYDRISGILKKEVDYTNTWRTLQDEIVDDLKSERSLLSTNFNYLDERFRVLIDINLSNFYDKSVVKRGEKIETPPGKPEATYLQWGMEDKIDLTIYNRYHQLVLSPYVYFIKQNDEYLQNLLRGTLLYTYNPNSDIRPYHKSQADTVLKDVSGRPILLRETVGASLNTERIKGKVGSGIEKQIQYPENPLLYGIETLLDINYPFTKEIKYTFNLDSFVSFRRRNTNDLKARAEITNALSYKINSLLGVSVKYKWFNLYSKELAESYKYSQILLSLDINTDFKLF